MSRLRVWTPSPEVMKKGVAGKAIAIAVVSLKKEKESQGFTGLGAFAALPNQYQPGPRTGSLGFSEGRDLISPPRRPGAWC